MATVQQAFDLAFQHHQAGRLAEAEALYRQILAANPDHAEALHRLGIIAQQLGRHEAAVELIRQTIVLNPRNAAAHSNLGEAYRAVRRFEEAADSHRRALQLDPGYAEAYLNLGNVHFDRGELDDAIAAYGRACELKPAMVTAHYNLGNALRDRGRLDEAIAAFRIFLQAHPDDAEGHNNLGVVLAARGKLDEAISSYRQALKLNPNYAVTYNNLGNVLFDQGRVDDAIELFRRAVELKPEYAWMHNTLVYALHFQPAQDDRNIADEQRRWNRKFSEPLKRFILPHANERSPERRLRIGYVSADFRGHVVGRNVLPLLEGHDHERFESLCYAAVTKPDDITARFRGCADQWRDTAGVSDEALAEMIRQDGVDILVDLTQHMAGNRLPVFARHAAPVQVSFAGYPESTGVEAIEYRISDRWLESEMGERGSEIGWKRVSDLRTARSDFRVERVFLIESFWCYDPGGMEAPVNALPAKECGQVTFGSLNNFCKVNDPVLKLWARVLREVKDSRLVMLTGLGSQRQRTLEFLGREGIAPERVEFVEQRPRKDYLELHHRLDVVLDTFPYNGHTTSLDALWMGVPVVSLAGKTMVSRAGWSQLSNLSLPEWVAHAEHEYVEIATQLACDLPRLAELRRTLRARMEASVLMDAPRFAHNVETAYRAMWRRWCAESAS